MIQVLRRSLLEKNDRAARQNRTLLDEHGVVAVNIMGGAGCGKTTLLEHVIPGLRETMRIAVLEGDLATTRDAERIAKLEIPVIQLLTEGGCHLTAELVSAALDRLPLDELDLLIIENVGNPICPANFDLGERLRVVVLSTTEGDDKPAKYPLLFKVADLIVLAKMDLQPGTNFDEVRARRSIRAINENATVTAVSDKDENSMRAVGDWIRQHAAMQVGVS